MTISTLVDSIMLLCLLFTGCSKGNGIEKPKKPNNSVQKPQIYNVKTHPGNKRIKFVWKVAAPSNMSVKNTVIYWNKMKDSLQIPITLKPNNTIKDSVIINHLSEGTHSFTFVATGSDGTTSTKILETSRVYGPDYQNSLENRKINYIYYKENKKTVYIMWDGAVDGEVATEVKYKSNAGKIRHVEVSPATDTTRLNNYTLDNGHIKFSYQSLFLPKSDAIDTFSASVSHVNKKVSDWSVQLIKGDSFTTIDELVPRADGYIHVNTPATIKKLKELNINAYEYLIKPRRTLWEDLRKEFLPAAKKAGIRVLIIIKHRSSYGSKVPYPYGGDYKKWAKAIARLSLQYPNLIGWSIDDFSDHLNIFTPSYTAKIENAAKKINPKLKFKPVVYAYNATSPNFYQKYESHIDGIIFPYKKFYRLKPLSGILDQVANIWPPNKSVVLMVYAYKHSHALYYPPVSYVRGALQTGLNYAKNEKLAGVVTFALHKEPKRQSVKSICGHFVDGLEFQVFSHIHTKAGNYAKVSQQVQVDSTADKYHISFWQRNSSRKSSYTGYHIEQLLIDGQVVWHNDVATDGLNKPKKISLDLTKYLQGKNSATIIFRLYEKKGVSNYHITANFGTVKAKGFSISGFSKHDKWSSSSNGPIFIKYSAPETCNPNRLYKMFDSVKDLYGSYGTY